MNNSLNQSLVGHIRRTYRPAKFLVLFLLLLMGLMTWLCYSNAYHAATDAYDYTKPGLTLILGTFFFVFTLAILTCLVLLSIPSRTPFGKMMTKKKDRVKRIFIQETQVTAYGANVGNSFFTIVVCTDWEPGFRKSAALRVPKSNLDSVFGTIQQEFQGYRISYR
jgi:hypothetical protein